MGVCSYAVKLVDGVTALLLERYGGAGGEREMDKRGEGRGGGEIYWVSEAQTTVFLLNRHKHTELSARAGELHL